MYSKYYYVSIGGSASACLVTQSRAGSKRIQILYNNVTTIGNLSSFATPKAKSNCPLLGNQVIL